MKKELKWKYEIGQVLKTEKKDIIIIDRLWIQGKGKCYKYKCNICGFECGEHLSVKIQEYRKELWTIEDSILLNGKCSCCSGRALSEGHNDIPTTEPWMVKYFQGGCDEAKSYTKWSNKMIYPICPECGRIKLKTISISNIYYKHSIGCECSDKTPYPEKVMFSVLDQLGVDFTTQLSKRTFDWCDKYKYDFYIKDYNICLETHGLQHYERTNDYYKRTLDEEIENDLIKKELALSNGIKEENYIIIDCRYSKLELIKNSVLTSNLKYIFNLSIIDWEKVQSFALKSLVAISCEYWNSGIKSVKEIAKIMNLNAETVRNYLNRGAELNLCDYGKQNKIKDGIGL